MSQPTPPTPTPPSPLASPEPWDLVADGYVSDNVPLFERFAEEALRFAAVAPGARVLDVAAGPGTLALLAARDGAGSVDAIDFSPEMIARLEARAAAAGRVYLSAGAYPDGILKSD